MNYKEYLLTCLAEEANEVAQAASKCLRFDLYHTHPEYTMTNLEQLVLELSQLEAMKQLLAEIGVDVGINWALVEEKKRNFKKYLSISERLGTLELGELKDDISNN